MQGTTKQAQPIIIQSRAVVLFSIFFFLFFFWFGLCSEGGFPSATDRLINLTRYAALQFKGFALQALSVTRKRVENWSPAPSLAPPETKVKIGGGEGGEPEAPRPPPPLLLLLLLHANKQHPCHRKRRVLSLAVSDRLSLRLWRTKREKKKHSTGISVSDSKREEGARRAQA